MKKPIAPRLDKRVAFDRRQQVDDGYGNFTGAFVEIFVCWGAFTYLRGTESVIAARLEGRQPLVVRVRATNQTEKVDHDWQMRNLREGAWEGEHWKGPVYAVRSIIPTDDRLYLDITVERGVAT